MALTANAQSRFNVALADPTAAAEIATILNAATSTELAFLAGVTAGTVTASKGLVVDANKDLASLRDITTRKVKVGDSANDHTITIEGGADEAANRTLTIPAMGGNDTLVLLGTTQTLSGAKTFSGGVTIATAALTITDVNVVLSATTGTKIGTATTQKLGFYNATPIVQPSAYTQTYATADKTHAAPTATTLTHTAVGGTADGTLVDCTSSYSEAAVEENFKELATTINLLIADVADVKQLVNSVIDDLQNLGLVG